MADSSIGKAPTAANFTLEHINESNAAAIVAGLSVLTAITLTVVCLRFYVRVFVIKVVGSDDWWMLVAMVSIPPPPITSALLSAKAVCPRWICDICSTKFLRVREAQRRDGSNEA